MFTKYVLVCVQIIALLLLINGNPAVAVASNLLIIVHFIYHLRRFKAVMLLVVFMSTYYMNFAYVYYGGYKTTYYDDYFYPMYYDKTLLIMSLFLLVLYLFTQKPEAPVYIADRLERKSNWALYLVSLAAITVIIVLGKSGENILESGGYGMNSTATFGSLAISEYVVLFIILGYYYSRTIPYANVLLLGLSFLYIAKMMLFGGRIEALQVGMLLFILFWEKRLSPVMMLAGGGIIYYVFMVFGRIRADISFYLQNPENINFGLTSYSEGSYMPSNAGEVLYNSTLFSGLLQDGLLGTGDRLAAAAAFVMRIFLPTGRIPFEQAELSNYLSEISPAGGGGFIASYFFYFFGFAGVAVIAIVIAVLLNKLANARHPLFLFAGIIVLTTFPRWLAYDPITMFKMSFYMLITAVLYAVVHELMAEKPLRKRPFLVKPKEVRAYAPQSSARRPVPPAGARPVKGSLQDSRRKRASG